MKALYDLKDKLHDELEEIARKPEMGAGDLELVHKLTDTIKNIDKICMLEEEGGYSNDGEWAADMRGTYGRGSSYANRGKHYVRGHYSRDDGMDRGGDSRNGYSSRRDSRGRYSRDDGREEMIEHVKMAIETAPEEYKGDIKRFLKEIEG